MQIGKANTLPCYGTAIALRSMSVQAGWCSAAQELPLFASHYWHGPGLTIAEGQNLASCSFYSLLIRCSTSWKSAVSRSPMLCALQQVRVDNYNHGTSCNHPWFAASYAKFIAPQLLGVDMPEAYMGVSLLLYLHHHWSFFGAENLVTKELQEVLYDMERRYGSQVAMFPDLVPEAYEASSIL